MPSGKEPIIVPARGCKFIAGDPRVSGWSYCGATLAGTDTSWCEEHLALVYGKPLPKPKPAAPKPAAIAKVTPLRDLPKPAGSLEDPLLMA